MTKKEHQSIIRRIWLLYADGFRNLPPWARSIWVIILIKLFIMFAIFKLFFFRDTLNTRFATDEERSSFVIEQITKQ